MKRSDWTIEIRDSNLMVQGLVDEVEFAAELIDNNTSAWSLSGDASPLLIEFLQANGGIFVSHKGMPVISGPLNGRVRTWEVSGQNFFSATGVSDDVWLERRVCYPDSWTFSTDEDVRTGPAETVGKGFVSFNLGPTADVNRQLFGLVIAGSLGLGTTGTWRGRMQYVADLLREIALQGGDLTFGIIQTDNSEITFDMKERLDLSNEIIFTPDLGNVSKLEFTELASSGNVVHVGGEGEGSTRPFVRREDTDSINKWGRIERFISDNTTDTDELNAKGDEELAKIAGRFSGVLEPVETKATFFGVGGWNIGDIVGIEMEGIKYSQAIRKAQIKLTPNSAEVSPLVGTPDTQSNDVLNSVMDALSRIDNRVRNIERG